MTKEKFTKGEWKSGVDAEDNRPYIFCGDEVIADVFVPNNSLEQANANACLISAAPSMYRELNRQCILCKLSDHETECELCSIGGILKKARGEE
jgi:hypothetical protein